MVNTDTLDVISPRTLILPVISGGLKVTGESSYGTIIISGTKICFTSNGSGTWSQVTSS